MNNQTFLVFFHRNSDDECILDGPWQDLGGGEYLDNLWCCAKGPVAKVFGSNETIITVADFVVFVTCYGNGGWSVDNGEVTVGGNTGDCTDEQVIRFDFNLDGGINLADFVTLATQFGSAADEYVENCSDLQPPISEGSAANVDNDSGYTLTDTSADFVSDGVEASGYIVDIISGTGVNAGAHEITGVTSTVLTLATDAGDSGAAGDVAYEVYALDLNVLESFVEDELMDLGEEDPFWVDAIDDVLEVIQGYAGLAYDDLEASLIAINFSPVAEDTSISTPKNTAKTIQFVPLRSDPDGDVLKVTIFAQPAHGTLGSYAYDFESSIVSAQYTPDADYTGPDELTFKVREKYTAEHYEAFGTVSITVTE